MVLPTDAASLLAESHRDGYHCGLWHLTVEYEQLMAMAMLTNSTRAPGDGEPKTFSAWPRRHNVALYHEAAAFREHLSPSFDALVRFADSHADRIRYLSMVQEWHRSISYVSRVSGHTQLNKDELEWLIYVLCL